MHLLAAKIAKANYLLFDYLTRVQLSVPQFLHLLKCLGTPTDHLDLSFLASATATTVG